MKADRIPKLTERIAVCNLLLKTLAKDEKRQRASRIDERVKARCYMRSVITAHKDVAIEEKRLLERY